MPATAPGGPRLGAGAARGGAAPAPAGGDRPRRDPLRGLTVLYDPGCRVCRHVAGWLARQRKLIPVRLVPVGSPEARRRFPSLDHEGATRREITAVGDAGQVYVGQTAWVVVLWALADHRPLAHAMSTPAGRRLARAAVLGVAKYREAQLGHRPDLPRHPPPPARHPARPIWVYDPATGWVPPPGPVTGAGRGTGCTDGCPPPG
jgi:predicted DCC family thiol-disulfide oxidoreductase YuxK